MKKKLKDKGITLLALIITIVLLLILAGVTLNIAIGDNGLLKKSKEAVNKGKLAQTEELIKMDLLSAYIDAELLGMGKPSAEIIKKIIESHGGTIDESNPNMIKLPNGEIKLDDILGDASSDTKDPDEINKTIESLNNRITELNKELEAEKSKKNELQNQVTELNTQVADWKKKAEDGEVTIAQRDKEINNLNNEIETKSQRVEELEGNITTLTNEKSTLETQVGNLNTRIAELEGKQATGDALASDVLAGKTFSTANGVGQTGTMVNRGTLNLNFSGSGTVTIQPGYYSGGTISSGLIGNDIIKQITGNEIENTAITIGGETVWIPAGFTISPESTASVSNGIVVEDKKGNEWVWVPCTDFSRKDFGKQSGNYSQYSEEMPSDQNASVTKYGGYYIGRYEAGKDGSDNVIIQKNKTPYNNIAIADCKIKSSSFAGNNNYDTNKMFTVLCSSYAWDSALTFIEKTNPGYATNSPQGNYSDTEYGNDSIINTGLTTPVCNIYDMGGNLWEYTTESSSNTNSSYVERGGKYHISASDYPAGYRISYHGGANSDLGFRSTLFLK